MKSFKQFLAEMPFLLPYDNRKDMDKHHDEHVMTIRAHHDKATEISPNHYVLEHNKKYYYYHANDKNEPHSITIIHKHNHQQFFASKGIGGSASNIHKSMHYHLKKHSQLNSDTLHSRGGKKLWKDFIKSSPKGVSFKHTSKTRPARKVTAKTVDKQEKDIWNQNHWLEDNHHIQARIKPHE